MAKFSSKNSALDGVEVRVDFVLPHGETKPPQRYSLNAIFPLKTALYQLCGRAHVNAKNARLWRTGAQHDELLDMELTPSEAGIGHNEQLIVEVSADGYMWTKQDTRAIPRDAMADMREPLKPLQFATHTQRGAATTTTPQVDTSAAIRNVLQRVIEKNSTSETKAREDAEVAAALQLSKAEAERIERQYEKLENTLLTQGLRIERISDDGNCLFRAVALQVRSCYLLVCVLTDH